MITKGLRSGFDTGISALPVDSLVCSNLLSARREQKCTSDLISSEVSKGFLLGPFSSPPFPTYRINPIGIAEHKYSKKKRLIVDLSAPHNDDLHPSLNSLIDKDKYSLSYVRIDDAIDIIKLLGQGAKLCKVDIADAFKQIPIDPNLWHLHGICWDNKFYFYTRLVFGCRSSPKIFDSLSQAICWIAQNVYHIPHILHLLDDFLTIDPPSANAHHTLSVLTSLFNDLNVPLAVHKTAGPASTLEYLGIILDSEHMEARLPADKLCRISQIIATTKVRKSVTKRELLSLLGHLHFAMRIIRPGRSFVSYLLTLAHSVKELHHHVRLTKECQRDLDMWHSFLSNWNGVSFFLQNMIRAPDFNLFTDASSLVGFGGYFNGRWFQGLWQKQLNPTVHANMSSMSYLELYPIIIAAVLWGPEWQRCHISFQCDNAATVLIINKGRSKCSRIMCLMRKLTIVAAKCNFSFSANHVPGKLNVIADALSRFQMERFRQVAPSAAPVPCECPAHSELIYP